MYMESMLLHFFFKLAPIYILYTTGGCPKIIILGNIFFVLPNFDKYPHNQVSAKATITIYTSIINTRKVIRRMIQTSPQFERTYPCIMRPLEPSITTYCIIARHFLISSSVTNFLTGIPGEYNKDFRNANLFNKKAGFYIKTNKKFLSGGGARDTFYKKESPFF